MQKASAWEFSVKCKQIKRNFKLEVNDVSVLWIRRNQKKPIFIWPEIENSFGTFMNVWTIPLNKPLYHRQVKKPIKR